MKCGQNGANAHQNGLLERVLGQAIGILDQIAFLLA
jgi:hypothetical protein